MASSLYLVQSYNNQPMSCPQTPQTQQSMNSSRSFGGAREWIKLVGLPYTASEKDVREFMNEFPVADTDSIFFVVSAGKPCGRAFVHLSNSDEAAKAARELNKKYLGQRYIDVRQITLREVQRELREVACRQESIGYDSDSMPVGVDRSIRNPVPFLPQHRAGNCVKLVGLPFSCTEQQIADFMEGVKIREGGVHFMTRNGKPSGNCVVELEDPLEAYKAVTRAHRKYLGRRFIEVYLARPCDLFCDAEELKNYVRLNPLPDTISNEELATTLYGLGMPAPQSMTLLPGSSMNTIEAFMVFEDEEAASVVTMTLMQHYSIEKIAVCTAHAYKAASAKRHSIQHNSPAPNPDAHGHGMQTMRMMHTSHSHQFSITPVPFSYSDTSSDATRPPSPMNEQEGKTDGHAVFTHDPYSLERFASTEVYDYYVCDNECCTPLSCGLATTTPPQSQLLHTLITGMHQE